MVPDGTFSAAQWQQIKDDLAAFGIDLDTARLPPMRDEPWWPTDSTLRGAIQDIAGYYGTLMRLDYKPPTALERAAEHQATLDALATAFALVEHSDLADDFTWTGMRARFDHTWTGMRARMQRRDILRDVGRQEIADLEKRIAALTAKGKASGDSAKTRRNDYWREQTRLWLALTAHVSSRDRRAHLRRYLIHCSASLFADAMTEPELDKKLDDFLKDFFRPARHAESRRRGNDTLK